MSADVVIRAECLGKQYRIGGRVEGVHYTALRDVISEGVRATGRLLRGGVVAKASRAEEFWALRDVNFEIRRGEVVGIIGRNGAGKSTLLKVLSRITEPTEGRVLVRGRIASLLEVGTGFHPELTGRENVYLNGAILGMTRAEIKRKFDEIVDFAEVEKFLDTPVKRYSIGMYVRLAFAVAAHLEPEILVVDEVLAVGDAEFQKKCLGKMQDVAGHGRTVLFVSHNMAAIQSLCNRGILIELGQLLCDSSTYDIIRAYVSRTSQAHCGDLQNLSDRKGSGRVKFDFIQFETNNQRTSFLVTGAQVTILVKLSLHVAIRRSLVSILFSNQNFEPVMLLSSDMTTLTTEHITVTSNAIMCQITRFPLTAGRYYITLYLEVSGEITDLLENAISVDVENGDFFGTGKNLPEGWIKPMVLVDHIWCPVALQPPQPVNALEE